MKPVLVLTSLACAIAAGGAGAETYKCVAGGKLTISDTPCPSGAASTLAPPESTGSTPSPASPADELKDMKAKLEVMQRERHAREVAAERVNQEAKREEAARAAAGRKAEEEKIAAQRQAAQRRAALKRKKLRMNCPYPDSWQRDCQ
ncbi:MAG: DUF4124 domain-containing protein [Zoogloeaceae bacterium]|nr:DUF4124 domain-containing protein [Zoogloeaceae bacterium]